jgi:hypothetical protein
MAEPAIIARHRDRNGEIGRKHGNTLIRTLRKTYGPGFARGCAYDANPATDNPTYLAGRQRICEGMRKAGLQ